MPKRTAYKADMARSFCERYGKTWLSISSGTSKKEEFSAADFSFGAFLEESHKKRAFFDLPGLLYQTLIKATGLGEALRNNLRTAQAHACSTRRGHHFCRKKRCAPKYAGCNAESFCPRLEKNKDFFEKITEKSLIFSLSESFSKLSFSSFFQNRGRTNVSS